MTIAPGLPTEADAVVVGAGAFGLGAAYQLARLGAGRVLVLDAREPGTQSSGRAAGLFKSVQADEPLTRLAALSREIVLGLAAVEGVDNPVVRSGSVLAARTEAHAALIRREVDAVGAWGIETEWLDASAVRRLAPYLVGTGLRAAVHVPTDCFIEEPITLLAALVVAVANRGGTVRGDTPVTRLLTEDGRVAGVETPDGVVRTERVVDAAGAWVKGVAGTAGVRVPTATFRHQLAITRSIAGVAANEPITRLIDASAYCRPCRGGLMFGGFEQNPLPFDPVAAGPDFTMDDVPLDLGVVGGFAAGLAGQVPAIPDMPLAEHRGGVFTMTPDSRFLVGPIGGVEGLWVASGCNGSGYSMAPGLGLLLAERMLDGDPTLDPAPWDPGRFGTSLTEEDLVAAGAHQYANYYTPTDV